MERIIKILQEFKAGDISLQIAARHIKDMMTIISNDHEPCEHVYGPIDWIGPCNGIRVCEKCGHELLISERD